MKRVEQIKQDNDHPNKDLFAGGDTTLATPVRKIETLENLRFHSTVQKLSKERGVVAGRAACREVIVIKRNKTKREGKQQKTVVLVAKTVDL